MQYTEINTCIEALKKGESLKMKSFDLFRNEMEVVKTAIELKGGREFQYASKELRGDFELCALSISDKAGSMQINKPEINGIFLQHASNELKSDKNLFKTALKNTYKCSAFSFGLKSFPKSIREDKELMTDFHNKHGGILAWVGPKLKDDKEFVLDVLSKNGWLLEYASDRLRDDKEVVKIALKTHDEIFKMCSKNLKDDKEIVMQVLEKTPNLYIFCSDRLKLDKEICLKGLGEFNSIFNHLPQSIKDEIGNEDPKAYLTKVVASEKLSARLTEQLKPKIESREQSMKMKI